MKSSPIILSVVLSLVVVACADEDAGLLRGNRTETPVGDAPVVTPVDTPAPTCADLQTKYVGFGGTALESTRTELPLGTERARMKPFRALRDDYVRLLGAEPASLATSGPTFGEAPPRWFAEPAPGAVSLYQAYRVGFDACNEVTKTDAKWAAAPTLEGAKTECAAWEKKFWNRTPTPEEIEACAKVAATDSAKESAVTGGTKDTEPRRRWAYVCASVLTSGEFVMY